MGHSRADKAESRERILAIAARQIREGGLDSVSIGEVMKAANLTHGGFYGHFPSRTALIAAALERALVEGEAASLAAAGAKGAPTLKSIANSYLSPAHRDHVGEGCAISALAGDAGRAEPEIRAVMREHLEDYFSRTAAVIGDVPDAEDLAVSSWCAMIGAMMLARVFQGDPRSDQILRLARQTVLDLAARARDA